MKTHVVYLALGTNLGDRVENLRLALRGLCDLVQVDRVSSCYDTEPWGITDQPKFLNIACSGRTEAEPQKLLAFVKALEVKMGRQESVRYGPRLIDIDILFFENLVLETPTLTIPHPRLHERAFVLIPLSDIAAELRHPLTHKTITEMLAEVDRQGMEYLSTGLEKFTCDEEAE